MGEEGIFNSYKQQFKLDYVLSSLLRHPPGFIRYIFFIKHCYPPHLPLQLHKQIWGSFKGSVLSKLSKLRKQKPFFPLAESIANMFFYSKSQEGMSHFGDATV